MSNSPPPLPYRRRGPWGCILTFLLAASVLFNMLLCGILVWPEPEDDGPREKHLYGSKMARDKVAVVRADGPLVEGLDAHILKQIQKAGKDADVKAVVIRIDSPGGTIGASEDIYRELGRLRSGQHPRFPDYKSRPLVASMGSIAASGGYYIAMPAEKILAERTTLTGSIGVYAALPNVAELANKNGVKLELIKAGGIKGAGSPLHELTPQERQPWQEMVDQAYDQFLDVVAKGRPQLTKERLRSEVVIRKQANVYNDKGDVETGPDGKPKQVPVERYRADGGTFTAEQAKQFGLIDDFGLLEDAVTAAAKSAGLGDYRVVHYERPPSLLNALFGVRAPADPVPDLHQVAAGLTPRLWYMSPQCELGGIVAVSAAK